MGILDNLENAACYGLGGTANVAWEIEKPEPANPQFESSPMPVTDNMGRETFWEDIGRPENDGLALKLFSETVCSGCDCQK